MIKNDLTGRRFGRLTVIRQGQSRRYRHRDRPEGCVAIVWVVKCDCGVEKDVEYGQLMKGHTRSCGCLQRDLRQARITHGHARKAGSTPEYGLWKTMRSRCQNPKARGYEIYGGRGISVCERWYRFENFIADMGRRPSDAHMIDRIDPDGDYGPDNCRWVTRQEQNLNKRCTLRDDDGEPLILKA